MIRMRIVWVRIRLPPSTCLAFGALLVAVAPLLLPSAARARVADRSVAIAQVRWIHRGLTIQPPHGRPARGKIKQPLYSADSLRTGASQRASISFRDGTMLHLNQRTDAVLRSPHLTYVQKGEADEVLAPGTNHQIQTATAVAAAIGTEFDVRIKKARSIFIVVEGALLVENAKGSVLVKTNQETSVAAGKPPTSPAPVDAGAATSWTDSIPPSPLPPGENVALDANGGMVVAYSSQAAATTARTYRAHAAPDQTPGRWDARFINDGRLDHGWASAQGQVANQWVKLGFRDGRTYPVEAVALDPAATQGHLPSSDLKDFVILVSTTGTDAGSFTEVLRGTCKQLNAVQVFTFPQPVQAKYLELLALSNYGNPDSVDVAEMEVITAVRERVTPTPRAIGAPPAPTATPTPVTSPTVPAQPQPTAMPTAPSTYRGYRFSGLTLTYGISDPDGNFFSETITDSGEVCGPDPYAQPWTFQGTYQLSASVAIPGIPPSGTYTSSAILPAAGYRTDFGQGGFFLLQFLPGPPPQMRLEINWGAGWGAEGISVVPQDGVATVPVEDNPSCP